jgi:membrane-associated phospholipid phosphatase
MNHSASWQRRHYIKLLILFGGVLAPLYLFGMLAEDVVEKEIFFFDKPILLYIHSHANPLLDAVMIFFTRAGSAFALVPFNVLVFLYLLRRRDRMQAVFWVLAVGGAALLNGLAKHVFARTRPELWVSALPETTFSFPSGHAMQSMAVAAGLVVLAWHSRWRWPVALIGACFVFLVGLSRVYLGVHFPSDILAGWAASLAWVVGLSVLFKDVLQQRRRDGTLVDASPAVH